MRLIKDYLFSFDALWDEPGQCRIRVYEEEGAPTVYICSEVPENRSASIVTVVEWIATAVWQREGSPESFIWIEHYPANVAVGGRETFHHVTFARPPAARFYSPEWLSMSRNEVQRLVGQHVE